MSELREKEKIFNYIERMICPCYFKGDKKSMKEEAFERVTDDVRN